MITFESKSRQKVVIHLCFYIFDSNSNNHLLYWVVGVELDISFQKVQNLHVWLLYKKLR